MKSLQFCLKTNGNTMIDTVVNYLKKDNIIKFKYEEDLYEYNEKENTLKKTNQESSILIDFKASIITITLIAYNTSVDMEITDIKYEKKANEINLEYTFQSDEKTTNCILIKY